MDKEIIICPYCGREFFKKRKGNVYCTRTCGVNANKGVKNPGSILKKRVETNELFNIVNDFVYKIKGQKYMADREDIYEMILIHDKVYPQRNIKGGEDEFEVMFYDLCVWWKEKKDRILGSTEI